MKLNFNMNKNRLFISLLFFCLVSACTNADEEHIYTLYSTNYPNDSGRSGIATFDLVKSQQAETICQETADLLAEDFQRRKKINNWSESTKARYWCEKGRFKK
jgi:hypothetical protein